MNLSHGEGGPAATRTHLWWKYASHPQRNAYSTTWMGGLFSTGLPGAQTVMVINTTPCVICIIGTFLLKLNYLFSKNGFISHYEA